LDDKLKVKIKFEISQIDKLISEAEPLLLICSEREPDFIERTALASILHSFYNGVESIFVLIAKNIDNQLPKDDRWHKALLDNMFNKTNTRSNVLEPVLKDSLIEYMEFRHFFRHAYSFQLDWNKMKKLGNNIKTEWEEIERGFVAFIA
jgi:hypothetical protein